MWQGKPVGRMEFVLFTDVAPRSAENFRQLCTGEAGTVTKDRDGAGTPYHYKVSGPRVGCERGTYVTRSRMASLPPCA